MLLSVLFLVFCLTWGVKARNPVSRPDNLEEEEENAYYESNYTSPNNEEEWTMDSTIEPNFVPVPGQNNMYMVLDDNGKIKEYAKRIKNVDGSYAWQYLDDPNIPDKYEKVDGSNGVYKVTDKKGRTTYYKFVRNKNSGYSVTGKSVDSFSFVKCDKNGKPLDEGQKADKVDTKKYKKVTENVYAVYDDNHVKTGYRKRVKTNQGYVWKECEAPKGSVSTSSNFRDLNEAETSAATNSNQQTSSIRTDSTQQNTSETTKKDTKKDGSYTITETQVETKTKNGQTITYQTILKKTYDKYGKLKQTKKEGPYEVSRTANGGGSAPDQNKIESSLDAEYTRVKGSVSYDTNKANEVLAKLNAQRKENGLNTLTMQKNSEAYQLACIKAADMALYNYSSSTSPMYGTLESMLSRWGIHSGNPSENIWRASTKTAEEIHSRFQANEGSRKVRMSSGYTQVGIAVVEKNGQTHVAEVYLK